MYVKNALVNSRLTLRLFQKPKSLSIKVFITKRLKQSLPQKPLAT
jgi:hypothetical protein